MPQILVDVLCGAVVIGMIAGLTRKIVRRRQRAFEAKQAAALAEFQAYDPIAAQKQINREEVAERIRAEQRPMEPWELNDLITSDRNRKHTRDKQIRTMAETEARAMLEAVYDRPLTDADEPEIKMIADETMRRIDENTATTDKPGGPTLEQRIERGWLAPDGRMKIS